MTTFALVHGAWGSGWHWASLPERLRALGHDAVAPDLPCDDPAATFDDYADVVLDALGEADDVVVVGSSLGGHTAARVALRRPVREIVYVAALVPVPGRSLLEELRNGERPMLPEYLAGVEGPDADGLTHFSDFGVYWRVGCHELPEDVARERWERCRPQSVRPHRDPIAALPEVPSRYVLCTEDRLVDPEYWRTAARGRLGVEPVELPGDHQPMASRPEELVRLLVGS